MLLNLEFLLDSLDLTYSRSFSTRKIMYGQVQVFVSSCGNSIHKEIVENGRFLKKVRDSGYRDHDDMTTFMSSRLRQNLSCTGVKTCLLNAILIHG